MIIFSFLFILYLNYIHQIVSSPHELQLLNRPNGQVDFDRWHSSSRAKIISSGIRTSTSNNFAENENVPFALPQRRIKRKAQLTSSITSSSQAEIEKQINVTTSSNAKKITDSDRNVVLVNLKYYPNYSAKINLRNIRQFPCILTTDEDDSDKNCSIVLIPPQNHGLLITIQQLNLRLNTRPDVEERCVGSNQRNLNSSDFATKCQCKDYLLINNKSNVNEKELVSSEQICGQFYMNKKQKLIINNPSHTSSKTLSQLVYLGDSSQFTSGLNQNIKITLFHGPDHALDYLYENTWELNENIGGEIIVTSFKDCSNNSPVPKHYKECNPIQSPSSFTTSLPKYCIVGNLFCDGNANCKYIEGEEDDGFDETSCTDLDMSKNEPSVLPLWKLLPIKFTIPTIATTTTMPTTKPPVTAVNYNITRNILKTRNFSGTHFKSSLSTTTNTSPSTIINNNEIVNDLNDVNIRKPTSPKDNPWYRNPSSVFIVVTFITIVVLTCCFAFVVKATKLPDLEYNNYAANTFSRNETRFQAPRSSSVDSFDNNLDDQEIPSSFPVAPPPAYAEVSELPSYDSVLSTKNIAINNQNMSHSNQNILNENLNNNSINDNVITNR